MALSDHAEYQHAKLLSEWGRAMEKDKSFSEPLRENQGKEETDGNGLHLSGGTGQLLGAPVPSTAEMQCDSIWKQNSLTAQFVKN